MDNQEAIVVHDETEDSIAIRQGHMDIYVFHVESDELYYNGPVNAVAMTPDEAPDAVLEFAEGETGLDVAGITSEQQARIAEMKGGPDDA